MSEDENPVLLLDQVRLPSQWVWVMQYRYAHVLPKYPPEESKLFMYLAILYVHW